MPGNVQLRDVEPGDLPLFFENQRDSIAVAMVGFRSRDRAEFDAHWTKVLADESSLQKTIISDGKPAGNVVSWNSEGQREVGYWIDRAHWGRGIATAALSAFLKVEQTRPLCAHVAKHNLASIRVLQKWGFTQIASGDGKAHDNPDSDVLLILTARATA